MTLTTFLLICLAVALAPLLGALLMWVAFGAFMSLCGAMYVVFNLDKVALLLMKVIDFLFVLVIVKPVHWICDLFIKKEA